MQNRFKTIKYDNNYWIQKLMCKCKICANQFVDYLPLNYELVLFEDINDEKFFLPTFGKYGYIELLKKLVPTWQSTDEITFKVAKAFEEELKKIIPFELRLVNDIKCPKCKKNSIEILKRINIFEHPVNWVEIDIDKLEKL